MIPRRLIGILVPLAAAGALAGCGGGGGGDTGAASSSDPATSAGAGFTSQGVSSAEAASQAVAALGSPGSVDTARVGETVADHDTFAPPRDAFKPLVNEDPGSGATNGAETATGTTTAPVVSPTTTTAPSVSVGGAGTTTPGGTTTAPGGGGTTTTPATPVTSVKSLEADFDVSGEPVVAREGDSIPPDTQQFTVKTIGSSSVILQLNAGLLPDGSDTVTLKEGESITLYNQTARQGYKLRLVDIRSVS
jgi:hypothetical protein